MLLENKVNIRVSRRSRQLVNQYKASFVRHKTHSLLQ